ncbi:hypothetical protein PIIN_11117 [Serendipita indica DSM 11827]|uniref:Uncharacterized protein n=1 Tax=Serendipita indica (strain DSM 11827) TaxID=1109443 RepID=G4U0P1_SERID|nr:hypothetical protein PIIN_11117 [Serendipita indica DSM 11827]
MDFRCKCNVWPGQGVACTHPGTNWLWDLLGKCWSAPNSRPSSPDLLRLLEEKKVTLVEVQEHLVYPTSSDNQEFIDRWEKCIDDQRYFTAMLSASINRPFPFSWLSGALSPTSH